MEEFLNLILDPFRELLSKFNHFLPNFMAMILILVIGTLLAYIIRLVLMKFLTAIHFDIWSDRMGFTKMVRKGDLWSKPSKIMSTVVFWLLIFVTLMSGLNALQVVAVDLLVNQFFTYIPRIFSGAVILIVGAVISGFISRAILIAAANRGFHYAKIFADTVQTLLLLLVLAMVMEQLQIAPGIVLAAFSIIFGGIVLALAIAFGVGGIDAARRVIERDVKGEQDKKDDIEHI